MELFHVALLIHDDVVDHASVRRGGKAFHVQVGDADLAIIWGDYLFSLVMDQFLQLKSQKLSHLFSRTFIQTCVGQLQDLSFRRRLVPLEDILESYARKTGVYGFYFPWALAFELNQEPYRDDVLEKVSQKCGMIYQIADDLAILDPHQDHKSAQSDFEQGQMTYVLKCLEKYLGDLYTQPRSFSDWIAWVRQHPGTQQALQDVRAQMDSLVSEIKPLCFEVTQSPLQHRLTEVVDCVCVHAMTRLIEGKSK